MKLGLVLGGVAKGAVDTYRQLNEEKALQVQRAGAQRKLDEQKRVDDAIKAVQTGGPPPAPAPSAATPSPAPAPSAATPSPAPAPVADTSSAPTQTSPMPMAQVAPLGAATSDAATTPASIINNNWGGVGPLNGGQVWPGQNGTDGDGNPTFADPWSGIHATVATIKGLGAQGVNTVGGVASHWSLPDDPTQTAPDPTPMAQHVAWVAGTTPTAPVDLTDDKTANDVAHGVFSYTNGAAYPVAHQALVASTPPPGVQAAPPAAGALPSSVPSTPPQGTPPPARSAITQASQAQSSADQARIYQIAQIRSQSSDPEIAKQGQDTMTWLKTQQLLTAQASAAERAERFASWQETANRAVTPQQIADVYNKEVPDGYNAAVAPGQKAGSLVVTLTDQDGKVVGTPAVYDSFDALRGHVSAMLEQGNQQAIMDEHNARQAAIGASAAQARAGNAEASLNEGRVAAGLPGAEVAQARAGATAQLATAGEASARAGLDRTENQAETQDLGLKKQITDLTTRYANPSTSPAERAQLIPQIAALNGRIGVQTSVIKGPGGLDQSLFTGVDGSQWTIDQGGNKVAMQDLGTVKPALDWAQKHNIPLQYGQPDPTIAPHYYIPGPGGPSGQAATGSTPAEAIYNYNNLPGVTAKLPMPAGVSSGALPATSAASAPAARRVPIRTYALPTGRGGGSTMHYDYAPTPGHWQPNGRGGQIFVGADDGKDEGPPQ